MLDGKAFRNPRRNLQTWSYQIVEADVGTDYLEGFSGHFVRLASEKSSDGIKKILIAISNFTPVTRVLEVPTGDTVLAHEQRRARGRWQCSCGEVLFDDYREEFPGPVRALDHHLNKTSSRSRHKGSYKGPVQSCSQTLSFLSNTTDMMSGLSARKKENLPMSTTATRSSPFIMSAPPTRLSFLLTCLKLGSAPLLRQEKVCEINSDREIFHFLRRIRSKSRSRFHSLFVFSIFVQIRFVHFELFPNDLVNILSEESPPDRLWLHPSEGSFRNFSTERFKHSSASLREF